MPPHHKMLPGRDTRLASRTNDLTIYARLLPGEMALLARGDCSGGVNRFRAIKKKVSKTYLRAFGAIAVEQNEMKTAQDTTEARAANASRPVEDWIVFAAICPKCQRPVLQHGYSRVLLFGFLDVDHPIEAYCAKCDGFWRIDARERRALLGALSPALPERRQV